LAASVAVLARPAAAESLAATTVGKIAKATPAPKKPSKAKTTAKVDEIAKPGAAEQPVAPTGPPPAASSPMAELKKSNAQLDKVLQKNRPNWSPEAELQRAEVRKVVGSFLDYAELARRALARHWEGLTPKQREEFVSTLRELVERSYLKQVHGNANYNIKYEKEEKAGPEATVNANLNTVSRG